MGIISHLTRLPLLENDTFRPFKATHTHTQKLQLYVLINPFLHFKWAQRVYSRLFLTRHNSVLQGWESKKSSRHVLCVLISSSLSQQGIYYVWAGNQEGPRNLPRASTNQSEIRVEGEPETSRDSPPPPPSTSHAGRGRLAKAEDGGLS